MHITINEENPLPLYTQIANSIKEIIRDGELKPGNYLPSVRNLAKELRVNLHTVHKAYQELNNESVIILRSGQRAKVASLRYMPATREEIEIKILPKLDELITEAYYLGISKAELKMLLEEALNK